MMQPKMRFLLVWVLGLSLTVGLVWFVSYPSQAQPSPDTRQPIRLVRAEFDPLVRLPDLPENLRLRSYPVQSDGLYLVQFDGPIQAVWKEDLSQLGAQLFDYVPTFSFLVWMDQPAAALAAAHPHVRWVGLYQPAYRLSPKLDQARGRQRLSLVTLPIVDQATVRAELARLGASVHGASVNAFNGYVDLTADADQLPALARLPWVVWIEPHYSPQLTNDIARSDVAMKAEAVWQDLGLYGAGQVVGVLDTGLDVGVNDSTMNDDFEGRIVSIQNLTFLDAPDDVCTGHGTHVAGSVLGNGVNSGSDPANHDFAGSYAGLVPDAQLVFQAAELHLPPLFSCTLLIADLSTTLQLAYDDGARIHTNSWSAAESEGTYTIMSQQVDQFVWTNPDLTVLFSQGNTGVDDDGDGVVDLTMGQAPGTAKNCITVGASENYRPAITDTYGSMWPDWFPAEPISGDLTADNPGGMAAFSGRGFCADGRLKPDLVAPGTWVLSVFSQANNPFDGGTQYDGWGDPPNRWYKYLGGTSMSGPLTAGAAAIVRQYFNDVAGLAAPSSALIKATLINGAYDMTPGQYGSGPYQEIFSRPDPVQGWGRVDLAYSLMPAPPRIWWFDDHSAGLSTGDGVTYTHGLSTPLNLTDDSHPLRVSLVWADYPGTPSAGGLINDLDLEIIAPDGTHYYGNGTQWDRINNVEGVDVLTPSLGLYTIVVKAYNVAQETQPYALVVSGAFEPFNCDPLAGVALQSNSPIELGQSALFTATVTPATATLPIQYTWDFGDGSGHTSPLSTTNHLYDLAGSYTATITATNCAGAAQAVDAQLVVVSPTQTCAPVAGLDLSLVTTGTLYVGDPVDLILDVIPDDATKPYTYTVSYGDGSLTLPATSSQDPLPLSHTYATTGSYTVEVAAWNCDMGTPITDSLNLTIYPPGACVGLERVTILGETAGYLGVTYTFDTEYSPLGASLPITYLWDNGEATPSSSRTFATTGTHTLIVTATNCSEGGVALVTDTHPIEISSAPPCTLVTGLDLTQLTPDPLYPDDPVRFQANLSPDDAAKPYTYTVDYGDGTVLTTSSSADPLTLSHTYASTGSYTVELAAWNCDMVTPITDALGLTISPPPACTDVTGIAIQGPSSGEPGVYTFSTTYTPTDATEPIAYLWDNGDTGPTSVRDLDVGTHSMMVAASNCATGQASDGHQIVVSPPDCVETSAVDLSLVTTGTLYVDEPLQISLDVAPNQATKPYHYIVYYDDGTIASNVASGDPLVLGHTYTATGTYALHTAVWNCDMATPVSDSLNLTIREPGACVDLSAITIQGPSSGYPGVYTFSTTYTPTDATFPIAYLWANGDVTPFSVRMLDVGSHDLVVAATNCASGLWSQSPQATVIDSHQIVISPSGYTLYLAVVLKNH